MTVAVDTAVKLILAPDGAHSSWGPSGAKKWINCSGSINAAKGKLNKSSTFANEGTAAHAVSELCRQHNVKAEVFRGFTVRVSRGKKGDANYEEEDFVCDQVMIDSVQEFVDYCNDVEAETVLIEALLPYAEYVRPGFGTLDDARISDGMCVLTDFKHGKGVQVYAEDNEQLKTQALSVYLKYRHFFEFKNFVLRIAQPRLGHFDEWPTTLEDLLAWAKDTLAPAYLATLDPKAPRAAGNWCQFCAAKQGCEERTRKMMSHLVGEFEDITEATDAIKSCEINTGAMSSGDVARCLSVVDQIAAWIVDVKAHAKMEAMAGRPPCLPGEKPWKFVAGRSKRIFNVPEDELIAELKEEGLEEKELYTCKFITPAKLEKKIGKKHDIMADCVTKLPGKPKLVPPTDKRPSMDQSLLAQFADLDDDEKEDDDGE